MTKQVIHTDNAPAAIGPYSQAIRHNDTVYVSGQIPLDPATGEMVSGGIEVQIHQVFANLRAVADASGSDLSKALKITVFLTDLGKSTTLPQTFRELPRFPGSASPPRGPSFTESLTTYRTVFWSISARSCP